MAAKKRSKRIPKAQAEAIARHVRAYIDREYKGVQRQAEKGMGISQSHLSAIMRPEDRRGPGLDVLLRLRVLLRMSLDELVGLPPFASAASPEDVKQQVRIALLELVRETQDPDELPPDEGVKSRAKA